MMQTRVRKTFFSFAVAGAAALGAAGPAQAIVVSGSWDPMYGSPFLTGVGGATDDMWWSGTALFTIADTPACAANAGNGYLVTCSDMYVSNASVLLTEGSGGTVVDTLNFSGQVALTKVQFAMDGTTVLWVESNWWDPLAAGTATEYNLSNYLFSVGFSQQGANLFHTELGAYLEKHGGHGPGNNAYFWNGEGVGHIGDLCGPTTAPSDGDKCGFSDDYGTMVFAPIPEPSTYALMFAGLGAVGFMARRRRQKLA